MKVQVNNKEVEMTPASTLTQLAAQLELPVQGIAIAVNNKMIPRSEWEKFALQENDNLVVIKAACGGEKYGQSTIYHPPDRSVYLFRIGTHGT
jgi:sulfur carrier protein